MAQKALESVKLPTSYVRKVRKNKKETGVSIAAFICQAIDQRLSGQITIKEKELIEPVIHSLLIKVNQISQLSSISLDVLKTHASHQRETLQLLCSILKIEEKPKGL